MCSCPLLLGSAWVQNACALTNATTVVVWGDAQLLTENIKLLLWSLSVVWGVQSNWIFLYARLSSLFQSWLLSHTVLYGVIRAGGWEWIFISKETDKSQKDLKIHMLSVTNLYWIYASLFTDNDVVKNWNVFKRFHVRTTLLSCTTHI